jgi:hypothetical protein
MEILLNLKRVMVFNIAFLFFLFGVNEVFPQLNKVSNNSPGKIQPYSTNENINKSTKRIVIIIANAYFE